MVSLNLVAPSRYRIPGKDIRLAASQLAPKYGFAEGEQINIVFVGRRKMKEIARKYKNEDVALPVLSFPYPSDISQDPEELPLAAEIVICYPQAVLLAAERNKKVTDMIIWLLDHAFETVKRT